MNFFKLASKMALNGMSRIFFAGSLTLASSVTTIISADAVPPPITTSSVQQAPYSRVFYTDTVYAVKDRDYKPGDSKVGFFSVWSKKTSNQDL
jgi:hypothetical protein